MKFLFRLGQMSFDAYVVIWTHGIAVWGTASNSDIEMLQRYQNKVLRAIVNIPWYIFNKVIHADLKV